MPEITTMTIKQAGRMMKDIRVGKTLLGMLLALGFTTNTFANVFGKVELVPTSPTTGLYKRQVVTFNVFIDFESAGGTLGGGFDVVYDPTVLNYLGSTSTGLGDPAFGRDPDDYAERLLSWAVGDFDGILSGLVGSIKFEVLTTENANTVVEVTPTVGIAGPWVNGFESFLTPDYLPNGGVTLTFSAEPRPPTTYQYNGTVTYCLPEVCDNFAALKVGSVVAGTIDIATSPNTLFDSDDVGAFSYTVTNPDLPITTSEPPVDDAVANPLYVYYVDELNNNAVDRGTLGITDSNNLFTPDFSESFIEVNGSALQGFIYQYLSAGTGCFNPVSYNYCSEADSIMIWEGEYSIKMLEEIFADGFE